MVVDTNGHGSGDRDLADAVRVLHEGRATSPTANGTAGSSASSSTHGRPYESAPWTFDAAADA